MAGSRSPPVGVLALAALAVSMAVHAVETVATNEMRLSEASHARVHAASGVERMESAASVGLHSHSQKAEAGASLRGLRSKSRSSHGLRANVFRAASSTVIKRTGRRGGLSRQAPAPLFIPKIGLANVTQPTPFPPPPPVLHPWAQMQPLDTAVGNYLISGFIAQPTITPPPTQASLDLAFACPALITWPNAIAVNAPDPCGSLESGKWTDSNGGVQIKWDTSCLDMTSPGTPPPSVSPVTTYSMPNGDLFATSQVTTNLMGGPVIEIRDCGGATIYRIEEKRYKQVGKPEPTACKKFGSCDGVIYFQFFIKNAQDKLVALTPYTTIFQESFDITDPAGGKIATVSRDGWDPPIPPETCEGAKPRLWNIKYESSPPGLWGTVTNQWPLAAMMTMLAHRDTKRQPDGSVIWSNCEALKATGTVALAGVAFCCCVCVPMVMFLVCSAPILRFAAEKESSLFPKRMGKPSSYIH